MTKLMIRVFDYYERLSGPIFTTDYQRYVSLLAYDLAKLRVVSAVFRSPCLTVAPTDLTLFSCFAQHYCVNYAVRSHPCSIAANLIVVKSIRDFVFAGYCGFRQPLDPDSTSI